MTTTTKQEPIIPESQFLTFNETMRYLRVSRSTLNRLIWSRELVGHKVGSAWRFHLEDVKACIREVEQ